MHRAGWICWYNVLQGTACDARTVCLDASRSNTSPACTLGNPTAIAKVLIMRCNAQITLQLLSLSVTVFTVGSIFFLRTMLMTWICTRAETPESPTFLKAQPDIECNTENDDRYANLNYLSWFGLFVYTG
eukprot:SAG25_NODE_2430_length_1615_cov_1.821240_3_plen_129_part_01